MYRERKFLLKANHHIQVTAQRFHDENALLEANFYNVEEEIMYDERHASRMHLRRYDFAVSQILELRQLIAAEIEERSAEDVDLLDTVIDTQKLLQQTVCADLTMLKVIHCRFWNILVQTSKLRTLEKALISRNWKND